MEKLLQAQYLQVAEIDLVYRSKVRASERPAIKDSTTAAGILRLCWDAETIELFEEFKVLLLNRANKVLGVVKISSGGVSGTTADPKLIFGAALRAGASGLIISHSHPSGNLKPSEADKAITRKLAAGAHLLDISLLDHIIITAESHFSFVDNGLL